MNNYYKAFTSFSNLWGEDKNEYPHLSDQQLLENRKLNLEYYKDCIRIQKVLSTRGIDWEIGLCQRLWEWRSEEFYCAHWLELPESDEDLEKEIFGNTIHA